MKKAHSAFLQPGTSLVFLKTASSTSSRLYPKWLLTRLCCSENRSEHITVSQWSLVGTLLVFLIWPFWYWNKTQPKEQVLQWGQPQVISNGTTAPKNWVHWKEVRFQPRSSSGKQSPVIRQQLFPSLKWYFSIVDLIRIYIMRYFTLFFLSCYSVINLNQPQTEISWFPAFSVLTRKQPIILTCVR